MSLCSLLPLLRVDRRGSVAIETAIVAPVLLMLALGGFDAGSMVARQSELQSAAAEAAAIVRATPPEDADARTTIRDVLKVSTNLGDADVQVTEIYRCGLGDYIATNTCLPSDDVSTYIKVVLTDTYAPVWTSFGIGAPVDYDVERTVQIS